MSDYDYAQQVKKRLKRTQEALSQARKEAYRAKARIRCLLSELEEQANRPGLLRLLAPVDEREVRA